ncbi:MAG: TRAP transporter small permease [Rhodospirillaceae bacterium]|nr:TRAP transporter small permease [Rhodospirillaceae bacterium]MYH38215.1 TRAP transporter small permease [Rhodospirillaceae bacterium]MYK13017.1 TRAP transporter small permease [Rhodospirillaceae bacterium]MYK58684.1 TRAP transporter small permease [Rhodospirillaceae bacterium]
MVRLSKVYDTLLEALGMIAALLLAFVVLGITAEIVVRGTGLGSLPWMIEIVEYSLLAVTFLAAPWVLKHSAHVSVDLLVEIVGPRGRRILALVANSAGLIVCAVIFYYGLRSTIELYAADTKIFKIMTIREWWLFALVPVSGALMAIEFGCRLFRWAAAAGEEPAARPVDTGL